VPGNKKPPDDGLPILPFSSKTAWERWLAKEHTKAPGLWLKLARKESRLATVTYAEALEVALCHGWIDGQRRSFDATYFLQRFSSRGARSKWSRINCASAERLILAGKMKPRGQAEVDRAKKDGRWEAAYPSPRNATIPEDLRRALKASPKAERSFESLDGTNRYAILFRLHDAKKPETRARRIEIFVRMLTDRKVLHPKVVGVKDRQGSARGE
jgi:uncharacterized protein YdeI (YjbR/CyaY-like superfamily)